MYSRAETFSTRIVTNKSPNIGTYQGGGGYLSFVIIFQHPVHPVIISRGLLLLLL